MSKIKRITVSNLKAISSFTADFNGCTAIITGKNDGGKSSFLKSLPDRLRGVKPPVVLKTGKDEGFKEVELTTGEILRWNFNNKTAKGEMLVVITKDEKGIEKKGSITKEIAQKYFPETFDIDEFLLSTPQKQRKILQGLVGLDFTEIDDRHKVAYDERTYANKKLNDAKVNLKPVNESLPVEPIDTTEIQQRIWAIDTHNKAYDTAYRGLNDTRTGLKKQKSDNDGMIKSLEQQIKKLKQDNIQLDNRIEVGEKWLAQPENQKKDDAYSFQVNTELQEAIDKNKLIEANNKAIKTREDASKLDIEAKEVDALVKAIELERLEMIRTANMPDGFTFADEGILYNGLPVDKSQISSSDIYVAALKLALMKIGEVRTLYFDASLLDRNKLADIEKWAHDNDLQLLIEKCDFEAGDLRYEIFEDIK